MKGTSWGEDGCHITEVDEVGIALAARASQMAIERGRTEELRTEPERRQAKTLDRLANDHTASVPYRQT